MSTQSLNILYVFPLCPLHAACVSSPISACATLVERGRFVCPSSIDTETLRPPHALLAWLQLRRTLPVLCGYGQLANVSNSSFTSIVPWRWIIIIEPSSYNPDSAPSPDYQADFGLACLVLTSKYVAHDTGIPLYMVCILHSTVYGLTPYTVICCSVHCLLISL